MSTVTFALFVPSSGRRKAGRFAVRIRVTYKRISRYIATNIFATDRDLDGAGNLKGYTLVRATSLLGEFYRYAGELNYFALQQMDVDDVVRYIRRRATGPGVFAVDFFEFAETEILPAKKDSTRKCYVSALNAFRRYLGSDSIDINSIDRDVLSGFVKFLEKEPRQVFISQSGEQRSSAAAKKQAHVIYVSKLRHIYDAARYKFNDEDEGLVQIPRNPFAKLRLDHSPSLVHSAKSVEFIQKVISFSGRCSAAQRMALDAYIISFALMGMNVADMIAAAPAKDGIIIYNRAKVRDRRPDQAEHHVQIDPRIAPLIERYKDPDGKRLFCYYNHFPNNARMDTAMRYGLSSWAKANNELPFTMYSARHSWATIARSSACKIDKGTVDDCLVHVGTNRMVDVYAEKDWTVLWDANRKVLDLFDWSAIL